jgi:hypothetical protein
MLVLVPLLTGCKVVDAPEDLEALMVYGFVNFENDIEYLEETEKTLIPLVEEQLEDLSDGYRVANLTEDDLAAAGVEVVSSDVSEIIGAMGTVDYRHDIEPVLQVATDPDKEVMFDNFVAYDVLDTSPTQCFFEHDCERLDQEVFERTKIQALGEGERTYSSSYRWVESEDLPKAVFIRQIAPEEMEFEGSAINMTVHQQYSLVMIYEKDGVGRRVEAFWVDAELVGVDVPDTFAVDTAVNTIANQAERIDTWIDEHP